MDHPQQLLKRYFGYDAFRPGQEEIIEQILRGRDVLAVMPTGAGKSVCYQIPALLLGGVTVVVSPLISLMKDQVDALSQAGIRAAYVNSALSPGQQETVLGNAANGRYQIVYVAPERLETAEFCGLLQTLSVSMVAVDEAHCVSQWGHDFRPSYTKIAEVTASLPSRPVVAAFTATATPRVRDDIVRLLHLRQPFLLTTGFNRENLFFAVEKPRKKTAALLEFLGRHREQSGIVYASTRKTVEALCRQLNESGYPAVQYHAGMPEAQRTANQDDFLYDRAGLMVATNAFGMGIDKSNISFVVHYNMPQSLESYYQEAGRAGRDGEKAECILYYSAADVVTDKFLIGAGADDGEKAVRFQKLNDMVGYCNTDKCLRAYILRYFGEQNAEERCGNCSNCNSRVEKTDITVESQKILSCVVRMGERFGSGMVSDVLHGGNTRKIRQMGFDRLSTFGIMKDYPKETIREMVSFLAADGYLELCGEPYPVLKLMPPARGVLRGETAVSIRRAIRKQTLPEGEAVRVDEKLFGLLRQVRAHLAQEAGVPPFVVFSDATLREMCRRCPADRESMLAVPGVGSVKFEKFGEHFLGAIREYAAANKIEIPRQPSPADSEERKRRAADGIRGTDEESYRLYQNGLTLDEIAKTRGLARSTVEEHLLNCLKNGMPVDAGLFVTDEEERMITEAARRCGSRRLKPIKESLPETIGYTAIRFVLCKNRSDRNGGQP